MFKNTRVSNQAFLTDITNCFHDKAMVLFLTEQIKAGTVVATWVQIWRKLENYVFFVRYDKNMHTSRGGGQAVSRGAKSF